MLNLDTNSATKPGDQQGKAKKKPNGKKSLKYTRDMKNVVGVKIGQLPGKWMTLGIGVGATLKFSLKISFSASR
ncbi:hypothetical protein MSBRW_1539 [Methanosarcina barkeri str. Wiesmoor]|uniref:Uncharacterized protein n=1 Tax=Methanosarcina barkeri str. Wiesmoor TaxID=1434109 RepID=A0A0E3QM81_METBA|nr:hypothetical protein [Methanosarcina barkeri]AKB50792.1 hypothetical protein MSBRW_1539 [Methanosarcina barkeri str. Wiesmoor]